MRGETPLDYAEFQLSPGRTRCDLFVSAAAAAGSREKVASGSAKPFDSHLPAVADARMSGDSPTVILRPQSHGFHTTTSTPWFSKGTLERFVRFVTTPEVLERVKTIEYELLQLEQVRDAVANTFSHSRSESIETEEARPDASKRELIRAMDARLNALHEEQIMAFARANAAGFDDKSITDLVHFAENFGAERLNDACTKFLALSRKRILQHKDLGSPTIDTISKIRHMSTKENELTSDEEEWFPSSKRRLDFGVNRVATNHPEAFQVDEKDGTRTIIGGIQSSSLPQNASRGPSHKQSYELGPTERVSSGSTFLTHLHKMAQKVESRSSEDFGWHNESDVDEKGQSHTYKDGTIFSSSSVERSSSLPYLRVNVQTPLLSSNSLTDAGKVNNLSSENEGMEVKESSKYFDQSENDSSTNDRKTRDDVTPAKRLSVAAAISLFESKKKDSSEPPFRKLVKQESRKVLIEVAHSPSEKSVLKRWNTTNSLTTAENSGQDSNTLHSEVERNLESDEKMKIPSGSISESQLWSASERSKEMFKKSLNDLFTQVHSNEHPKKHSTSQATDIDHVKEVTTMSGLDEVLSSNSKLDSNMATTTLQSITKSNSDQFDLHGKVTRNVVDEVIPSNAKIHLINTNAPTSTFKSIKKSDSDQSDLNGKVEQGNAQSLKVQNIGDETQQIISRESVSHRLKMPGQVPMEHESMEPATLKQERASIKRTDGTKFNDVSTCNNLSTRDNNQSRKSENPGKLSFRKTENSPSSMDIMLATPIDLQMQALAKMVENPYNTILSLNVDDIPNEVRGKFFDQYSRLRDAKLRQENPARRAEREAKLKSMQETLEKRKEEMESRYLQHSKRRNQAIRSSGRSQQQKAEALVEQQQKDKKDDDEYTDQEEYCVRHQDEYSDTISPVSTPHSAKNRLSSSKPRTTMRMVQTLPKSSNAPRNTSARSAFPKTSQGKTSSLSIVGMDGSVPKTAVVPHPSESRKDVTKSSSTRAAILRKPNISLRTMSDSIDDVSNVGNGDTSLSVGEREEVKQPLGTMDTKQNPPGSTQEARPFLRKGRGIGPGAGPNFMKQKASSAVDVTKIYSDDSSMDCKVGDPEAIKGMMGEEELAEVHDIHSVNLEEEKAVNSPMLQCSTSSDDGFISPDKDGDGEGILGTREGETLGSGDGISGIGEGILETMEEYCPDNTSENSDSPIHPLEENDKVGTQEERYAQGPSVVEVLNHKQKEGMLLSELLAMRNSDILMPPDSSAVTSPSMSFQDVSSPHGHIVSPSNNNTSGSHTLSSIMQRGAISGRFSPNAVMDSPTNTPENELMHSGRQFNGGPTRSSSMLSLPPKESSPKGFKRLLNFARKSRMPEAVAADCVSVSTTSEGDDDADDARESGGQLSDEFLRKLRIQKKGFELGDSYNFPDPETAQFFGSSIPPPPANFKLREEQLPGGNSTKGPRSFFSLSSFRSKGNEGKSR